MDEHEMERQHALGGWDEQSCREFEEFLDEMEDDLIAAEDEEPHCECYYVDVDVMESRFCPAHNPKLRDF